MSKEQQAAIIATLTETAANYTPISLEDLTAPTDTLAVGVHLITPQVALGVLKDHHASNRAVSPASKDAYRDDMLGGRWSFNGATFVFDNAGMLIDGQHRMGALADCVKTAPDFPGLPFLVVRGVDISAQETMDAGRKRSVADQLNIGHTSAEDKLGTKIVAALRALYLLSSTGGKLGGGKLTNAMLHDLFRRHKDIVKSVRLVQAKGDDGEQMKVRPAVVAAIHYAAHNLLPKGQGAVADRFVDVLKTGTPTEGYEGKDPAHALYVAWGNLAKTPSENEALKYISLAWSLYAEGQPSTAKAFAKVPVTLEPMGITRTDVTGEVIELPTSSQPAPEAPKPAEVKTTGLNTDGKGGKHKPVPTAAQKKAAERKAAKAAEATKGKAADGKPEVQPEAQPETVTA